MNVFNAQRASYQEAIGGRILLDYAVYFEPPLQETIDVCVVFSSEKTQHHHRLWGSFQLWLKDFDGRWFDDFWALFRESQVFRQQVKRFYAIASPSEKKATEQALSDQLEHAADMLKALGFPVKQQHIGNSLNAAYVEADIFPREIMEASQYAGFNVTPRRIETHSYRCQPVANLEANKALIGLLSDWANGSLQPGEHYAVWRNEIRTFSLVPSSIRVPMSEQHPDVANIVGKSIDGTLTYLDLAALRSGRDGFSNQNIRSLLPLLGLTEVPEITGHFEEHLQRKILRWMCRGLNEGLAIQKTRIDEISTEQQRQRSKQKQAAFEAQAAIAGRYSPTG